LKFIPATALIPLEVKVGQSEHFEEKVKMKAKVEPFSQEQINQLIDDIESQITRGDKIIISKDSKQARELQF